jgi:hypothetical protein
LKDSADPPPPSLESAAPASAPGLAATSNASPKVGAFASARTLPIEVQKSADKKQEQVNEPVSQTRARDDFETRKEAEEDNTYSANSAKTPSGPRRAAGITGERGGYGRKNKRDTTEDDETRNVAGRNFRRQGSSWVDTAYSSSQATINVRRGSEQFRALVADEPAIRDVANSLSGEVILVWKGKAYRIR